MYSKNTMTNQLYNKEYYEKNKQKYKDVYNMKVECPLCKKAYSKLNYSKHLKTQKHLDKQKVGSSLELTDEQKLKLIKLLQN